MDVQVANSFDDLPPVVQADGEFFSLRVLEQKLRDAEREIEKLKNATDDASGLLTCSPYDAIIRDRVNRGVRMLVGKHKAANAAHCKRIIDELDSACQGEAADTIFWLLWWRSMDWQTAKQVDEMRLEEIAELKKQTRESEGE